MRSHKMIVNVISVVGFWTGKVVQKPKSMDYLEWRLHFDSSNIVCDEWQPFGFVTVSTLNKAMFGVKQKFHLQTLHN